MKADYNLLDYTHAIYSCRVSYPVMIEGKLTRKYKGFKTKAEARRWIAEERPMAQSAGLELGVLSDPEKRAMSLWRQFKKTIPHDVGIPAIDLIISEQIGKLKTNYASSTLGVAVDALVEQKKAIEKKSKRYVDDIASKLKPFESHFGSDQILSTITTADLDDWLADLDCANRTKNHHRRIVGTLYNFGKKKGWCSENPIPRTTKYDVKEIETHVLSVDQMAKVLELAVSPDLKAGIIIQGFCGVRTAELLRLNWTTITNTHIKLVDGKKGKRIITIPSNATKHLKQLKKKSGPIWVTNDRQYYDSLKKIWDKLEVKESANILRHSFCTYHVAAYRSVGDTALNSGNSEYMIKKHYLNLATEKQGKAYFAL